MLNHTNYIEEKLAKAIKKDGILNVASNLNKYFTFEEANIYGKNYVKDFSKKETKDKARQSKSSKDSVLGKLVEEVIIYLLDIYFKQNNLNYIITNSKTQTKEIKEIMKLLKIVKYNGAAQKSFDADILILNQDNFEKTNKIYVLSAKGTTRERIGQFLSHLFLMDQDVLNAKYGKNRYEVIFTKENLKLKYGFTTLDWANSKDFIKHSKTGKVRNTVKNAEVQLILDDLKLGGGIYVLNNLENIDGVRNFNSLVGSICDYLK